MPPAFVAVHVGAGQHSRSAEPAMKRLCADACVAVVKKLRDGCLALDAAEAAVQWLENHPATNAGTGSALNWDGKVECDAAIMDDVKNPISLARKILEEQRQFGKLVKPIFICGHGAWQAARDYGLETFAHWDPLSGPMVTEDAIRKYKTNKERAENPERVAPEITDVHDTVGCIVLDTKGNMAVAVSTGGIPLKRAGRIGDSAVPGCGFWLERHDDFQVACCTTGTGEQLITSDFARRLCHEIYEKQCCDRADVITNFVRDFCALPFDRSPAAGFISLVLEESQIGEFWYGFTTESMGVGYMSLSDAAPTVIIDRLPAGSKMRVVGRPS